MHFTRKGFGFNVYWKNEHQRRGVVNNSRYFRAMSFPFYIARRYLFAKKSHNIINVISLISVVGILVSVAAMVIILSAFNGLEGIVEGLYTSFDSDLKIELKEGKSFNLDKVPVAELESLHGVQAFTPVIEEITLIKHDDKWVTCVMKGMNEEYLLRSGMDSMMIEGFLDLGEGEEALAVVGYGIQSRLGVTADPRFIQLVSVHGLVRTKKIKKTNQPFNKKSIPIGGVFAINPEFDEKYFIVPLSFAADLLEYENDVTGLEMDCDATADLEEVKEQVETVLGPQYEVKTYFEQNELLYETHKSEKWMTFVILAFILVLASFTLIASLTMLVIDKKKDIDTLASMGATRRQIRQVFFLEGILINFVGVIIGLGIGYLVCLLQQELKLFKMEGAIVPYYPVEMEWGDFGLILCTLLFIGVVATYFPVRYLVKRHFAHAN